MEHIQNGFRVRVELFKKFATKPLNCFIYIDRDKLQTIKDLELHISRLFDINNVIFLSVDDVLLPSKETVEIIKPSDCLTGKVLNPDSNSATNVSYSNYLPEGRSHRGEEMSGGNIDGRKRRKTKYDTEGDDSTENELAHLKMLFLPPDLKRKRKRKWKKKSENEFADSGVSSTPLEKSEQDTEPDIADLKIEKEVHRIVKSPETDIVKVPNLNETLIFKKLKMGEDYSPTTSENILGKIIDISETSAGSYYVTFQILEGDKEFEIPKGKFSLEDEEDCPYKKPDHVLAQMFWHDVIEPRVVSQ